MFFRKIKEMQSLIKSRTIALKRAESKIEQRDKLIKDLREERNELQEEAEILVESNADLRNENEELKILIHNVSKLANSNKYGNEKAILNKIKELVRDYQSKN